MRSAPLREDEEASALVGGESHALAVTNDVVAAEGAAPGIGESEYRATSAVAMLYRDDAPPTEVEPHELPELIAADENCVWVDLNAFTRTRLEEFGHLLDLAAPAVDAAIAGWERPQLFAFAGQFFVTVTVPSLKPGDRKVHAAELDLFVGNNFLVSAHHTDLPFIERVRVRAQQSPQLVRLDSAFLLYLILDELLSYYEELREQIEAEIELMEERALQDLSEQFLADLIHFKRYVYAFQGVAEQHRSLFAAFFRPDFTFVEQGVEGYFRDLERRLAHLLAALASARDAVTGAFDIYVSHVSFRTNNIIKVLTIVSTVLFSASVIVAVFGTNFRGESALYGPGGFVAMLLIIVLVTGGILAVFRRWGWL
jgi:magnesium transporter